MTNCLFYLAGSSPAAGFARRYLTEFGIPFTDTPCSDVTHLLLDVPSFLNTNPNLPPVLEQLSQSVTVIGGNLTNPSISGYQTIDLLQQESYLCRNAAITAHCALGIAISHMHTTFRDSPTLIIGWGRIGKCLAKDLKALGSEVWLCIRNQKDLAMANALGYRTILPHQDVPHPEALRLLFNTVPQPVLSQDQIAKYQNCIKIDLASVAGIVSDDVIQARGLPGKYAPESSGRLISQCILELLKEE